MSVSRVPLSGVVICALIGIGLVYISPALGQEAQDWPGSGPYMRVVDIDDAHMRLDMAVRLFVPKDGDGPTIALAGAMHIAEPEFFHLLQQFLDSQDLVLFEGVRPRGVGAFESDDDAVRVRRTQATIRFVAIMLHRQHSASGDYPATLEELVGALEIKGGEQAGWVRSSTTDAWGNALMYSLTDGGFDLRSFGADGVPGGERLDADLAFADQSALSGVETGADPGLQSRMAKALGLAFQLDELHHDGPTYRNSDLTIDQVQERVAARGGDASALFQILEGSSIAGRIARFVLRMIEGNPQMQAMMRIMLMETMRATDIENIAQTPGLPKGMVELMHVIVIDRNKVVIEDVKSVLGGADVPQSIGIVYGAGHMSDLERRLVAGCDYRHAGGFWLEAISVDIAKSGLSEHEIVAMRRVFKMMQPGSAR